LESTLQAYAVGEQKRTDAAGQSPVCQFEAVECEGDKAIFLQGSASSAAQESLERLFAALREGLPWLSWDSRDRADQALRATVAVDCDEIPFYTLLGYVAEHFEMKKTSQADTMAFLYDNICIERQLRSKSGLAVDMSGASKEWLHFSLQPLLCTPQEPQVADPFIDYQRYKEDMSFLKLRCTKLADSRLHQLCMKVQLHRPDGASLPAFAAGETGSPGVVMLQEWWGINDQVLSHAAYLASQGYRVLVPDLYRGAATLDEQEAAHLMDGLDWQGALVDISTCATFLKEEGCAMVGVLGFCMGGALSLAATVNLPEVDCGVVFYGICPDELADPTTLAKPLQAHFGDLDPLAGFSDHDAVQSLEGKLNQTAAAVELHRYAHVGHAFMNDLGFNGEDTLCGKHIQTAADLAWQRAVGFLEAHIGIVKADES